MELNLQQRVCIKFCVKNGFNSVKTLEMLGNCFGSDTLKKTAIYEWHERFKSGRESVEDFMDYGIVHHEFLPEGQTVNKEYYLGVMRCLREAVR